MLKTLPNTDSNGVTNGDGDYCSQPNNINQFFDGKSLYPEYMTDFNIIICPSDADGDTQAEEFTASGVTDPCRFWEVSYTYYGWAVMIDDILNEGVDENELGDAMVIFDPFFLNAMRQTIMENNDILAPNFDKDMSFTNAGGVAKTIYRLREGIERFFITDINNAAGSAKAQSEVPVMWDTIWSPSEGDFSYFSHIPGGGNVLYMDGHVSFLRYPSEWPVSRAMPQLMDAFG